MTPEKSQNCQFGKYLRKPILKESKTLSLKLSPSKIKEFIRLKGNNINLLILTRIFTSSALRAKSNMFAFSKSLSFLLVLGIVM